MTTTDARTRHATPGRRDLPAEPLGPGSLFWRFIGDWRTMLLAGRALVLQTAHPAVGAGVAEHSSYKADPYGRLDRTIRSVMTQVYGGAQAGAEGRRLREMHRAITGVDAQGRRYSALNPEAYLWVHATTFESFLVFTERFDHRLTANETKQLFDEWRRLGLLLGIRDRHLPRTVDEFWQMWERVVAKLENNPVVQDLMYSAPAPPLGLPVPGMVMKLLAQPFLVLDRDIIASTVSPRLRETLGLPAPTVWQECRLKAVAVTSRLAGRLLPEPLRYLPVARKARQRGLTA